MPSGDAVIIGLAMTRLYNSIKLQEQTRLCFDGYRNGG